MGEWLPDRFVRDGPVDARADDRGGLHMYYRGVDGRVDVQDTQCSGAVRFHPDGTRVSGAVSLRWADVAAVEADLLETRDSYDLHAPGVTVAADWESRHARVGRDMVLTDAHVAGDVYLAGATVGRHLNGRDAVFDGDVDAARVEAGYDVDLRGAGIAGDLVLAGTDVGRACYLPDRVDGTVDLRGLTADVLAADGLDGYDFRWDDRTAIGAVDPAQGGYR